jgi:hypothetical protein
MAIYRLIKIFRAAAEYAKLDPAKQWPVGCASPDQYRHHNIIVMCGKVGAAIGLLAGIAVAFELYSHPRHPTLESEDILKIVLTPFLATAGGILGGACWAGVFAPDSFINSPAGAYWAALIRAKSPATARAKALLIALLVTAFFVFFAICVVIGKV